MDKIVSAEKMRALEAEVFALGVDSFAVMEKAAMRVCDSVCEKFPEKCRILVVCGKGNNGGDGFAAARMLAQKGYEVAICMPFGEPSTPDAKKNFEIAKRLEIKFVSENENFKSYNIIIDALLGTGASKELLSDVPEKINSSGAFVVAVDIPSGICSDTGAVLKNAVKADLTVALAFKKYGNSVYPGKEYAGETVVADIGIPFSGECDSFETDEEFVKRLMPCVKQDAHKGENGRIVVVAGSKGMTGAASLSCEAALKSGGGLVSLFTPDNLNDIYEKKLTEAMTVALNCNDYIDADLVLEQKERLLGADAVVIGPGLGRECRAEKLIEFLFENKIPTVIDADGINAVAANINILLQEKGEVVLTPHMGEFSRLTGLSVEEILADRLGTARKFAVKYGVTLLLKGAGTVIAMPDGGAYINHTGNSGMATGGSGDVLSGIVGAFLAKKVEKCAVAAAYIHGMAGDMAAQKLGKESMLPTDIINELHCAFLKIRNREW